MNKPFFVALLLGSMITLTILVGTGNDNGKGQVLSSGKVVVNSGKLPDSTLMDSVYTVKEEFAERQKNLKDMVGILKWQQKQLEESQRQLDSLSNVVSITSK